MPNTENGRVTLAVAVAEIKNLREAIDAGFKAARDEREETRKYRETQEERLRQVEDACIRNEEQHKAMKSAGVILSTVQSTVAAIAGIIFGS